MTALLCLCVYLSLQGNLMRDTHTYTNATWAIPHNSVSFSGEKTFIGRPYNTYVFISHCIHAMRHMQMNFCWLAFIRL